MTLREKLIDDLRKVWEDFYSETGIAIDDVDFTSVYHTNYLTESNYNLVGVQPNFR